MSHTGPQLLASFVTGCSQEAYATLLDKEFRIALDLATEDELNLGMVPTPDERKMVERYLCRQNLRSLHTR